VIALRGARDKSPFLPSFQSFFAVDSRDNFYRSIRLLCAKGVQTRAAIGFAALVEYRFDLPPKLFVPLAARAIGFLLMGVKSGWE
jgi:hypothetical protein